MILVAAGILLVALALAFQFHAAEPAGHTSVSINVLESVELGGVRQWISIRGTDIGNPVLLYLHGGPGSANLAKLRIQCPELEEHFVVVNWDQRGAGKSYSPLSPPEDLTTGQLRKDAHQLAGWLRQRFGGRKIYLLGFSWGSALGLWTVHDYPDDFEAYISVSQEVNFREAERMSLDFVRRAARDANNATAMRELEPIDPEYKSADWYDQLMRQRKWLLAFGGVYRTTDNYNHEITMLLNAPEYSFFNFATWPYSSNHSLKTMWPELMGVDFSSSIRTVAVPVYFLVGRYDNNAPSDLTARYFEALTAPRGKELIWFEESAHDIFHDQPRALAQEIIAVLEKQDRSAPGVK